MPLPSLVLSRGAPSCPQLVLTAPVWEGWLQMAPLPSLRSHPLPNVATGFSQKHPTELHVCALKFDAMVLSYK